MLEVTSANAASIGRMFDAELLKDFAAAGEAKINQKNGAARTLNDLKRIFGDAVNFFPIPGSKAKDNKSNVLCDLGPHGPEGKQASWYAVTYDGSTQGQQLARQLQELNDAKKTYDTEAHWEADKVALTTRRNVAIQRLKEAIRLNIQLIRMDQDTEVYAEVTKDEDGSVIRSPKCIFIRDQKMTKFKQLSIGQFLGLDIDAAMSMNGGATYDNVVKTMKAEPKSAVDKVPNITKPVEFDVHLAKMGSYLDRLDEPGEEKARKALLTHLNEAGSDYLILSMDQLYTKLENYLELPSIKQRLTKLHEDGGMRGLEQRRQANAA